MREIVIIRHGETIANKERRYCGITDLSLSDEGKSNLLKLKGLYSFIDSSYTLYSSGLKRANESIELLFDNPKYNIEAGLQEMNFGNFENKTYDELKIDLKYQEWIKDVYNNKTPNGESYLECRDRIVNSFKKILDENKNNIVIVAHGGTMFHILDYLFKEDKNIYELQLDNGHGVLITENNNSFSYKVIE